MSASRMNETVETEPGGTEPSASPLPSPDSANIGVPASISMAKSIDVTRPSSLPKPSGLKQPTKIGRLCSNSAPKPAVPISPRTDASSSDTVRKLSDDLSRKHLSDLIEAEEDEVSSSLPNKTRMHRKASTSSTFSVTSMDALWEKHPRRLSEAGLRRSSDHSVILTEDTDSFIIGERVWVGGTKPGQIAYIGDTQFAPGEWAGIVLDEPIGKNDGSVAGVRYFQCAEKRGVFSRLTRLTRMPLMTHTAHDASPVSDASSVFDRPPSGAARPRRTLSPNGSIRSVVSSKMNASISTTTNGELRLGDRVIVSSSRGSKAGILRYVGVTDFASGIWAGVELDDPLGKNDGSVDGKRYFECAPRFGLFAPLAKVSRSPSNRKPGACVIHSNGRATPLRRSNSRESLTSLGTSIASSRVGVRLGVTSLGAQRVGGPRASSTPVSAKNALQELLREKQHHLERLMKERELERAEVAKVSLQADRAESALVQIRKEALQANDENEKLKSELNKVNKLLEDEKQKVEDLMFRNEEENINKEDYNKYKEMMETEKATHQQRIRDLEAEAALQTARADAAATTLLALEDQRNAETATMVDQHREELAAAHTLSAELQKLLDEAYALLKEKENEKDSLGKSMSEELTRLKADSEKALNDAKTKMAIAQTEFETQLSVVTAKLQLAESKLEADKQNFERLNKENSQTVLDLNTKLTQLQAALDDKTYELNKAISASKEHEVNSVKEITKLRMELSAKMIDLEQLEDLKRKQETTCKNLQDEITRIKEDYTTKLSECESLLNEASQQNDKSKSEIINLQQSLSAKTKDYEKLLAESNASNMSAEKLINEYKSTIHERDKEIIKLKDDFEQTTANFNIKHSKIAEEHKREIEERNTKIDQLTKEIENHKQALDQTKIEFDSLNSQFSNNVDELKALKEENEGLKKIVDEITQLNNDLKAKMSAMELEIGTLERQLSSTQEKCNELQRSKEKAETEYLNLTGQTTDSNEQFNKLAQHLKETEKELQELQDKHRESTNNYGRIEQELKQKLFQIQEEFASERANLVRSLDGNTKELELSEHKIKELDVQMNELRSHLRDMESKNDKLCDENSDLKKEIEAMKVKEQEITTEHEVMQKKLEVDIDKYKEEISILRAEGVSSEVKLMEKVDQLTEAQNDLNNKLEEARKHEDSLQEIVNNMTAQLNDQKSHYEKEAASIQSQLSILNEDLISSKGKENQLIQSLDEKDTLTKKLKLKLDLLEVDLKSNVDVINEKDRQIVQISEELSKSLENRNNLEERLSNATVELSVLKQKHDNLIINSSVEENALKVQQTQQETLKTELAILLQDKTVLEEKVNELSRDRERLKSERDEIVKENQQNIDINNQLKKNLEERQNMLEIEHSKNETDLNQIKLLHDEILKLKEEVANKNISIVEKDSQLTDINKILQDKTKETQERIDQLQNENEQFNTKYRSEVETLNNTINSLQTRISEQDKLLEELQQSKEKIANLQELLTKSDDDIKQLTNINQGQKMNYEDLNKQLQIQFDEYKKENKHIKHELETKLEKYQKELLDSSEKIKTETEKQAELQNKLRDAEENIVVLSNKLELLTVQQNSSLEKNDKLESLVVEIQNVRKQSAEMQASSEAIIMNLKESIQAKVKDLKQKDDLITKLHEDVKNQRSKVELAEKQRTLLEKEIASKNNYIRDNNDNKPMNYGQGDNVLQNRLQEEKEMVDGQVSFLNSVIVDMQRKNEQLLARVQALESAPLTDPPIFNGRKARAVAPRLFCDICDVFDAHDTEDCPRQAADVDAPAPPATGKRAPPPPRPYCDICEVFGHATENCDEEETF